MRRVGGAIVDPVQPVQPDARLFAFLLGFLLFLASQVLGFRSRTPAVVALVIQHHDRESVIQVFQHPARERVRCLRPLVHHGIRFATLYVLGLRREPVPVRHQYLTGLKQRTVLHRHNIELLVIVVRALGP